VSREKYHIVVLNWVAQGKGGRMWITSLNSHSAAIYSGTVYCWLPRWGMESGSIALEARDIMTVADGLGIPMLLWEVTTLCPATQAR